MADTDHTGGAGAPADDSPEARRARVDEALARVGRVVAVMSGKGGVGKSTLAASLALGLARQGRRVGLLDIDFHGPSVPTLLGLAGEAPASDGKRLEPVELGPDLKVLSLGMMLPGRDDAVIWRGPMKISVINQLLGDVNWGDLDVLVLDMPPGTGDEPLSIAQTVPTAEVVMVATPQEVAMADVRKAVTFCGKLGLRLLGLVETMGTVRCPSCGETVSLFAREGVQRPTGVPLLAEIPFDPALQAACDAGRLGPFLAEGGPTADALMTLAARVMTGAAATETTDNANAAAETGGEMTKGSGTVRYAIPIADGRLAMHFGHADQFALVDATDEGVSEPELVTPPPHAPGVLPAWLKEQQADIIIAGGMGSRAQGLFSQQGIEVVVGAPAETPQALVEMHRAGTLATGDNVCDH